MSRFFAAVGVVFMLSAAFFIGAIVDLFKRPLYWIEVFQPVFPVVLWAIWYLNKEKRRRLRGRN